MKNHHHYYRPTDQNFRDPTGTTWEIGRSKKAPSDCISGMALAYPNFFMVWKKPYLAKIMAPSAERMLLCEASGLRVDGPLFSGVRELLPIREVECSAVDLAQALGFIISVVGSAHNQPAYTKWAEGWISNADRSACAAQRAETNAAWWVLEWRHDLLAQAGAAGAARAARAATRAAEGDSKAAAICAALALMDIEPVLEHRRDVAEHLKELVATDLATSQ